MFCAKMASTAMNGIYIYIFLIRQFALSLLFFLNRLSKKLYTVSSFVQNKNLFHCDRKRHQTETLY